MALANITNNILTDSGILVTNLTPTSRTITINGTTYDLSADRSWTIATGVGGSGTTNYLPKFTGASTIGNSLVYDNGTNVGIGTATPSDPQGFGGALDIQNATYGGVIYLRKSSATTTYGYFGYDQSALAATIAAFGANNKLQFNAGTGAIKMTLDASGNLGLGVTPSAWATLVGLDIVEGGGAISSNQGGLYLSENAYFNAGWKYKSSSISSALYSQVLGVHAWYIAPSGTAGNAISFTQAMTLNASGNLSIGNTNDTYKLDVSGTGRFAASYTASGTVAIETWQRLGGAVSADMTYNDANTSMNFGTSTSHTLNIKTNNTTALSIASTGAATFSSSVTAGGRYIVSASSSAGITDISYGSLSGGVFINTPLSSIGYLAAAGTAALAWGSNNVIFYTNVGNERMRIIQNGNVGIGTTNPTLKLDVVGANGDGIQYRTSTRAIGIGQISSEPSIFWGSGTPLTFVSGSERMRLDASGNLGLGVTPSTWFTGAKVMQIGATAAIWNNGSNNTAISHNAIFQDATTLYIQTGAASYYRQLGGQHNWFNAPSGTAGNAISFTQAMTLDASGRLGIGVTSPTTFLDINSGTNPPIIKLTSSAVGQIPFSIRANIPGFSNSGFSIYDETAAASRLVISSTGNVGIGTTSPATPLDVVAGSGGGAISLRTNASDIADLYFFSNNGSTLHSYLRGTSTELQIRSVTNIPMLFYTNNTERMRITSGGSVLIGTTTEGFLGKLQVAGSVAITGQYNTVLPSSSFSYFDGSGQVVSSASNASALYLDTTWNTTGNPDGIYLNVTNTASGASSKLLNLKVGSVSQFSVSKGGAIQTSDPTNGTARPWKLGDARSGTISTDSYIIVEVNGVTYSIPALNGLP